MSRLSAYIKIVRSPAGVVFFISLTLLVLSMALTHRVRPYNSDDITWQTILLTWQPLGGQTVVLGSSDNFVWKIPFFDLFANLFSPSRRLVFLEAVTLAIAGFTLFYISAIYFISKARVKLTYTNLVPFIWLGSFGYSYAQLYLNPIWRGFDIGFCFALFALIAMVFNGDIKPLRSLKTKLVTLLVATLFGTLLYSDPYFLYFGLIPIVIFSISLLLAKKISAQQASIVTGGIGISYIVSKITSYVAVNILHTKMATEYPVAFVEFSKFDDNILLTIHSLLTIYGGDFFGKKATDPLTLSILINTIIVCFLFYAVYKRLRIYIEKYRQTNILSLGQAWAIFFGALSLYAVIIYTFSTVSVDLNTYRYFIVLVLSLTILFPIVINHLGRIKPVIVLLLILATVSNLAMSIKGDVGYLQPGAIGNKGNSINFQIISLLESKGISKGFASYWQGSINTFLSNGRITSLPVFCSINGIESSYWLIDGSTFDKPSAKSFYIIDPDLDADTPCTLEQAHRQFGEPYEIHSVGNKTIMLYDYDIWTKINPNRDASNQ